MICVREINDELDRMALRFVFTHIVYFNETKAFGCL